MSSTSKLLLVLILVSHSIYSSAQKKVAIIGGGMAGVSSAYYISQFDSTAKIILFEKEAKLGGNAQTVLVKNKAGELVNVDAGPQYFVEGPWDDYILFLEKTLGKNPYKSETLDASLLIQREKEQKPVLVSPLGMKLRGEKLVKLLKLKRFNKEAYDMYKHPEAWKGINIETWVNGLKFDESYKNEIIYPFLAASLGTTVLEIKTTSAVNIVKLFAFRKPKASNKFKVMTDGMGTLIQQVGEKISSNQVTIKCSSPVVKVMQSKDKWLVTYLNNGSEETELVDFVLFATHADQAAKIMRLEPNLNEIKEILKHLTYFEARIALHTDSNFVNNQKPAFLNIITNNSNQLVSSTMNLSMISERLDGIYKSWASQKAIEQLKNSGKLLHVTSFWHPLITTDFIAQLAILHQQVNQFPSIYLSGGWSEGLETQNSAVISGQHALEKYKVFIANGK
ncbi:NAD(P)-binding protein [Fluviicola taffensis]|uniref:FAD-dependent pyridine nucleotide-disulfide oxidoreductase n=1 Tax=Fluviicola taffensis (strain DSM 16823 / NCIMB 13979 / RW262) TaxID=755732 RepID=F2IAY5_FLUTR|nr:NAD(P)-binding protein [Fluviicola taffensis]AEA45309.1 FAD-dependent pyridine nucleotide-disulfide oxidoreductase [Fluviicola taffensis DSM 16823]